METLLRTSTDKQNHFIKFESNNKRKNVTFNYY